MIKPVAIAIGPTLFQYEITLAPQSGVTACPSPWKKRANPTEKFEPPDKLSKYAGMKVGAFTRRNPT